MGTSNIWGVSTSHGGYPNFMMVKVTFTDIHRYNPSIKPYSRDGADRSSCREQDTDSREDEDDHVKHDVDSSRRKILFY